jgi:hypothetical protein
MDRRSQLMALAVAFVVAATLLPATVRAAEPCLADPAGAVRSGKHWYFQTNQETQQKCWFVGARKPAARKVVPQSSFDSANQERPSGQAIAATCATAPSGQPPRGKRWSYQTEPTTGQKCWRLNGRSYRTARAISAQSPAPMQLATAEGPSMSLPQSIADAQASVQEGVPANRQDADAPPGAPPETLIFASDAAEPAIHEDAPAVTFESRWTNDFGIASLGNSQLSRPASLTIGQPAPVSVGHGLLKNAVRMLAAGPSLVEIFVVFVATLGSVVILVGFLDWSLLFQSSASSTSEFRAPLKLPKLEGDSDLLPHDNIDGGPASVSRRDRGDVLTLFAPMAVATAIGSTSRLLTETV